MLSDFISRARDDQCLPLLARTPLSSTLLSICPSSPRTCKFLEQKGSGSESGSSWQPPHSLTRCLVCVRAQSMTKNPERSSSSGFPLTHSLPCHLKTTVLGSGEETKKDARKLAAHLTTQKNKGWGDVNRPITREFKPLRGE